MHAFEPAVYLLCFITSAVAMLLLLRSYRQNRTRLLLWSALSFVALAINNFLLFVDIVLLPDLDLRLARFATAFVGIAVLLYAFIWELD